MCETQCFILEFMCSEDLESGFLMFWNANASSGDLQFQCFAADLGFLEMCISSLFAGNRDLWNVLILVFYFLFG